MNRLISPGAIEQRKDKASERNALRAMFVVALMVVGALTALPTAVPATSIAVPPNCDDSHWVGAWASAPSDSGLGDDIADQFDPSAHLRIPMNNSTARALATPSLGGSRVRIHLSNRFGTGPVTFAHVTISTQTMAAAVDPANVREVTFAKSASITVPAGQDVMSDPIALKFITGQSLAVSIFAPDNIGKPTSHYTARQTSYFTPAGSGDHTADADGTAFTEVTTSRPFLSAIDVEALNSIGTVVAFGDSLTDGYQGQAPDGLPETVEGIDANTRYPDFLAKRLADAGRTMGVANAAISGNRVLSDGLVGGARDTYAPSAISRLAADVLETPGITTVIFVEGTNDLGLAPHSTADEVIVGYETLIETMQRKGLTVLQGTLAPTGGATEYGTPAVEAARQKINKWIRTKSPADSVIDFDKVLRDPSDHGRINPKYDGGEHLHVNTAGNQAMADAVPLEKIHRPECTAPQRATLPTTPGSSLSAAQWAGIGILGVFVVMVFVVWRTRGGAKHV